VIIVARKVDKKNIDKNFFKAMAYELSGDIGAIDNEDMIKNRKLPNNKNLNNKEEK